MQATNSASASRVVSIEVVRRLPRQSSAPMRSSNFYYYFAKLAAILWLLLALVFGFMVASGAVEEGAGSRSPALLIAQLVTLSLLAIALAWVALRQLAIVECSGRGVRIFRNGRESRLPWSGVADVMQVPFSTPPVYRISFKTEKAPAYCVFFSWAVVSIGFWSWDFQGFVDYARSQIEKHDRPRSR